MFNGYGVNEWGAINSGYRVNNGAPIHMFKNVYGVNEWGCI